MGQVLDRIMADALDSIYLRMMAKVEIDTDSGCWNWTGGTIAPDPSSSTREFRGRIELYRRGYRAYRVMYELLKGDIPEGMTLHHLCRNPRCVNPDHLEPVSHAENTRRRGLPPMAVVNQAKTHCPKGHPLSGDNLTVGANGGRRCVACLRLYKRSWARKHRTRNNEAE